MAVKKVFIAHQSTIPPYRLRFYEEVEHQRPYWWDFTVVYDPEVSRRKNYADIDPGSAPFNIQNTRTLGCGLGGKYVSLQSFVFALWKYDLIVVENALNNLSYPLAFFYRLARKPIVVWGHGRDLSVAEVTGLKQGLEATKLWLSRKADSFFAYTAGVKEYLVANDVSEDKVFILHNTIDIRRQRQIFEQLGPSRHMLRHNNGLKNRKVLLYVGRLNRRKRLGYLTEAFSLLYHRDPTYRLVVVGTGDHCLIDTLRARHGEDAIDYRGRITDSEQLGPLYTMSDLYVFPGDVGLGPLQALCYDLTPVVVDRPTHCPEYEYLNCKNSVILPAGSPPEQYAAYIEKVLHDEGRWRALRECAWPSIRDLTIENMARVFVDGITETFRKQDQTR
jgi:glycosyltransferase involved in cell wall biosynthesis